jgi:hypothetical protein
MAPVNTKESTKKNRIYGEILTDLHTDKKEKRKKNFLIYQEIQKGSGQSHI